jgi:hypothetical protein
VGQSTNAILFYGYCWDEENVELFDRQEGDESDWPKLVLRKRGVKNPWDDYPEQEYAKMSWSDREAASDRWREEHLANLDAWHEAQKAVEEEFGVVVDSHCSGDCPMPYISAFRLVAHRGYPKEVFDLDVKLDWDRNLRKFIEEFGITPPQDKPRWWLVSDWN